MIGALLALALLAQSAEAEPDYAIPDLVVKDGDRWTVTVERSIEETGTAAPRRWTGRATYAVSLQRTMDRGNVVTWTPVTIETDPEPPLEALVLSARTPVVFRADTSLAPSVVENWDVVLGGVRNASTRAEAVAPPGPVAAARFFFREAELLSVMQNMPLERGKPLELEDNPPNPLGGAPIPAKLRFEPAEISDGVIRVRSSRTVAPEAAAAVLDALRAEAAKLGPAEKARADAQLSGLSLQRRDDCSYTLDAGTGQTRTAECVTVVGPPGKSAMRTERVRVTQSPVR